MKYITERLLNNYRESDFENTHILFEGLMNSTGKYTLNDSIENYKYLFLIGQSHNN